MQILCSYVHDCLLIMFIIRPEAAGSFEGSELTHFVECLTVRLAYERNLESLKPGSGTCYGVTKFKLPTKQKHRWISVTTRVVPDRNIRIVQALYAVLDEFRTWHCLVVEKVLQLQGQH